MNEIRKGKSFQVGVFTITPVEQLQINSYNIANGISISSALEPLGVLVSSQDEEWGIDIVGNRVAVEELLGSR